MEDEPLWTMEDRKCGPVPIIFRAPNGLVKTLLVRHAGTRLVYQVGGAEFHYEIWGLTERGLFIYNRVNAGRSAHARSG